MGHVDRAAVLQEMRRDHSRKAFASASPYATLPGVQQGDWRRFQDLRSAREYRQARQPEKELRKLEGRPQAAADHPERRRVTRGFADAAATAAAPAAGCAARASAGRRRWRRAG